MRPFGVGDRKQVMRPEIASVVKTSELGVVFLSGWFGRGGGFGESLDGLDTPSDDSGEAQGGTERALSAFDEGVGEGLEVLVGGDPPGVGFGGGVDEERPGSCEGVVAVAAGCDAKAGVFGAGPRGLGEGSGDGVVVDECDADVELAGDGFALGDVAGPDGAVEAVVGGVGALDGFGGVLDADDGDCGAEGFFGDGAHGVVAGVEDGGQVPEAGAGSFAAGAKDSAVCEGVGDVGLDDGELLVALEGAEFAEGLVGGDAHSADDVGELVDEGVGDGVFDVDAFDGCAVLAAVVHGPLGDSDDSAVEVAVGEDDGGVFAAQFDGAGDEALGGGGGDAFSGGDAPCEGDGVDVGFEQCGADVACALDDADKAWGEDFGADGGKPGTGSWGVF